MASSAALFQAVTTSALAGMPMLDARFIAPTHAMKSELLKTMLTEPLPSQTKGVMGLRRFLCQALFFSEHENASHNIGNDFLDFGGGNSRSSSAKSSLVNL